MGAVTDALLGLISCGRERFDAAIFDAFDARVGSSIEIPYLVAYVQFGDARILFDAGPHPDLAVDPSRRMGADASKWDISVQKHELAGPQLQALGIDPHSITHVALSHLHYDHAGGVVQFPNAEVLIQRDEWDYAQSSPKLQRDLYVKADFELDPRRVRLLDGPLDVLGSGEFELFPTPGHTPGHQSAHVRLDGCDVVLVGDASCSVEKLAARSLPTGSLCWNPTLMLESHSEIEARAQQRGAHIICSHDEYFSPSSRRMPAATFA